MTQENVVCDLCGEVSERELFYAYDKLYLWRRERFRVVQCRACGLVYVNPRPTPDVKRSCYLEDYPFYQVDQKKQQPLLHYEPVIKWIEQRVGKGSVLDIGTGASLFLAAMQDRGYEAVGTEVDSQIADSMRQRFGLTVLEGNLEELNLPDESFDAVTIMGVLEHVASPRRLLIEVHRVLKPTGVVALFCFHRGLEARFLGPHWLGFDVPRHCYSFSSGTLRDLLRRTGFGVDETIYPSYSFFPSSAQLSLARISRYGERRKEPLLVWRPPKPVSFLFRLMGVPMAITRQSSKCYLLASKIVAHEDGMGAGSM